MRALGHQRAGNWDKDVRHLVTNEGTINDGYCAMITYPPERLLTIYLIDVNLPSGLAAGAVGTFYVCNDPYVELSRLQCRRSPSGGDEAVVVKWQSMTSSRTSSRNGT